jgi:hypothetical protein
MKRLWALLILLGILFSMKTSLTLAQETQPAQIDQPAAAGDEGWDNRFGLPGIYSGEVTAMAVAADGTVYAGGRFEGGVLRWDGERWHTLGQGLNNYPRQLVISGGTLYAVGDFTKAGTTTTKGLAKWDGATWSRIGSGVGPKNRFGDEGRLNAIAVIGNNLYLGGEFVSMDGVTARNVARWDGTTWHALANGLADLTWEEDGLGDNGSVYALAAEGNTLYAGGDFDAASNTNKLVRVHNVASWDGSTWNALGDGVTGETSWENGIVHAMAVGGGSVYVGGDFIKAGDQLANNIARFSNGSWQPLGDGLTAEFDPFQMVETMVIDGADLYVGGEFDYAGGADSPVLAHWDGANWSPMAADIERFGKGEVHALALAPGGGLYVGGEFTTIDALLIYNIALHDGAGWHALGHGLTQFDTGDTPGKIYAMDTDAAGRVYVGGSLKTAGGKPVNNVALWDGQSWQPLGEGVDGDVRALVAVGDDVYVAGTFTKAGNVAANRVARWNRVSGQWSALGSGINDNVYALAYADGLLYAGGNFTAAGSATAYDLAYWDGAQWRAFGSQYRIYERSKEGGEVSTLVYALAVSGEDVVIGGQFQTIHKLGTDTQSLANYELANNVVIWNKAADKWYLMGPWTAAEEPGVTTNGFSGFGTSVRSLAIDGGDVYVGGMFNQAGSVAAGNIVRWHAADNSWHALAGGVGGLDTTGLSDTPVAALDVVGNKLVVGGYFTVAGNSGARYIALYDTLTGAWSALGSGIAYYNDNYTAVYAVTAQGEDIYVGGQFDKAGGLNSSGFAHWSIPAQADEIPAAGGAVTEDDGTILQFPAGAVPAATMLYYTPLFGPSIPAPADHHLLRSFVLEAMANGQPVTAATQPFTLRIPYTDAHLAALGIDDPAKLTVMRWNGTTWISLFPCAGCSVDSANKVVIATTTQFGEFALGAEKTAPVTNYQIFLPNLQR